MKKKEQPIIIAQIMGKWVGGGVESVIMNYYRHIDRSKIQFDFICDEDSTDIPYEEIEQLGGRVIICPRYQNVIKYQKFLIGLFKKNSYKIVHSNINTLSLFPLRAAKKAGVPIRIAHSHSTSNKKEWKKNIIKNILRLFSKKYATDFFACSELAGRYLFGDKLVNDNKVIIVNNAVDTKLFKYDEKIRKNMRKELNINNSTFVIGHIGRFVAQKNHNFIIDIFYEYHKKNNDSLLMLIGKGPLLNEIKNKVINLGLENNVIFLGQSNRVNELYQAMDLFLFPSLYEGLGMVAVEAQISGLPCVVSAEVPVAAKISKKINFVNLSDPINTWVSKIDKYCNDDRKNNRIDCNSYDIEKESIKLLNIYNFRINNKKKKNVCHFVSGLKAGGVESMIYNYCKYINNDYNFHLIYQHEPSEKNVKEFEKIGFKLKEVPSKVKHPIKNLYESYKYLKNNDIDIVHCHMTLMNVFPLLAAKMLNIKVRICHSHNCDVRKKNILIKYIEKILKFICKKYSTILVSCGEDAGKYMYNEDHFIILNNAMDLDLYKFDLIKRNEIRKKYNIKENDVLIGHIGRFTNQKNHKFLIDIFETITNKYSSKSYKLMLLGDGELKNSIEQYVKEKKLNDKVVFTGIVSNTNEFYSAFDVFLLPSLWEGLPVVSIESQISGLKCCFSSNIDMNCKLLKTTKLASIENLDEWVNFINFDQNYDRTCDEKIFNAKGYNIKKEIIKLVKIYECEE